MNIAKTALQLCAVLAALALAWLNPQPLQLGLVALARRMEEVMR